MNKTEKLSFRVFFKDCVEDENTLYEAIGFDGEIVYSSNDYDEVQLFINEYNSNVKKG